MLFLFCIFGGLADRDGHRKRGAVMFISLLAQRNEPKQHIRARSYCPFLSKRNGRKKLRGGLPPRPPQNGTRRRGLHIDRNDIPLEYHSSLIPSLLLSDKRHVRRTCSVVNALATVRRHYHLLSVVQKGCFASQNPLTCPQRVYTIAALAYLYFLRFNNFGEAQPRKKWLRSCTFCERGGATE